MSRVSSNQKGKIYGSIGLLFFSTLAVVSSTLCWFNAMRTADNNNNMIVVNSGAILKKITFHDCINISDDGYDFDKEEIGSIECDKDGNFIYNGVTNPIMGEYSLFKKTHPFLMLIELKKEYHNGEDLLFSISASTEHDFLGALDDDGNLKTQLAERGNPLSSVIQYSNISFANQNELDNTISTFEDHDTYTFNFNDLTNPDSFVKFSNNDSNYDHFNGNVTMFQPEDNQIVKYVGIVFDYYEAAVEYVYYANIGNPVLEQFDVSIKYTCDWELHV